MNPERRSAPGRVAALVLLLAALLFGALGVRRDVALQGRVLWDLDYYRTAAERWSAGLDPYLDGGTQTGYYYSPSVTPLVARAFRDLDAAAAYGVVTCAAVLAALWLAMRAVRVEREAVPVAALYALAFGNADALYACAAGNLSWLTGLLLAAALLAASRRRWIVFYCLLGAASLIKPYVLVLLAVPLALRALSGWAVLALVPLALDAALAAALWPQLPASRLEAIWIGVVEPLQLRYTLAGRLSRILVDRLALTPAAATAAATAAQLAIALALALGVRARRRPATDPGEGDRRSFALAVVAGFAALPRMAGYDAYLFGPAVFVAFAPLMARSRPRPAAILAALVLLAGLLKEGLAVLPLLALATLWLPPAERA